MNIRQMRAQLDQLEATEPQADDLVLIRPRLARKRRIEGKRGISIRVDQSLKERFYGMLDEVGELIGTPQRDAQVDYIVSEIHEILMQVRSARNERTRA